MIYLWIVALHLTPRSSAHGIGSGRLLEQQHIKVIVYNSMDALGELLFEAHDCFPSMMALWPGGR